MRRRPLTKEQKVAIKIGEMVNDVTLDLEEVGKTIANAQPTMTYNRVIILAEAAVEEKENAGVNRIHN
jgi:hypothetical protein